jgi:L-lactate dehydrogenase complex protein LldF
MSIKTSNLSLKRRMSKSLSDTFMRDAIAHAQDWINQKRDDRFRELGNFEKWRDLAGDIRSHVLENLDCYLDQFYENASKAGTIVHFARDEREAVGIATKIFQQRKARKAVKSKSMVTEEIELNEALEAIGVEIIETDLGEYLLQVDGKDKPSHIVVPALHKNRRHIRDVLTEQKGYQGGDVPEDMTRFVRGVLREAFLSADIGITGCNFGVAETGTIALMTNEGNGRFVTSIPATHIVFMGMERIVPTFVELDIMFSLLARSAVGARTSVYMSLITGPRTKTDRDGPEELHVIILDNGRSRVLSSPFKDLLRCIRCGSCLLECPAFRHIGGHAYGVLYSGPLGAALAPVLASYREHHDVTQICSLCSACNDVCPVRVPWYESILENRRVIAEDEKLTGAVQDVVFSQYGNILASSQAYQVAAKLARLGNIVPRFGLIREWTRAREMPKFPRERFREWFGKRTGKDHDNA